MIRRLAAFTLTLLLVLGVGGTAMLQPTSSLVAQVAPSALDFSAKTPVGPDGKLQPISPKEIKLEIINPNPASSVPWRVETSVPWVQVQPMSGEAPKGKIAYSQTLNVAVNIEGLTLGTHEGTLTIKAVDVRDNYFAPLSVQVKFEIPRPDVQYQPKELAFTGTLPQPAPQAVKVEVTNYSTLPADIKGSANVPWLEVGMGQAPGRQKSSQSLGVSVNIDVNRDKLAVGAHKGAITVEVKDAASVSVPVTLEIPKPELRALTDQLAFTDTLLGPQPAPQAVKVEVTNYSTLPADIKGSANVPWLEVQAGQALGRQVSVHGLSVSVNIDDLAKGTHTGQIKIEIPGAKPVEIPVKLEIKDPPVLEPLETIVISGAKIGGLKASADGKVVFIAASVGRESAVFVIALDTKTKKFFGKKTRGCPAEDEACLLLIRGLINPKDMTYCDAKKLLFIPGYDDNTLYISEVVFKDGVPTEAKAAKKVTVGQGPKAVAVTGDCTRAVTANEMSHTASIVDVSDPTKPAVIATVDLWPDKTTSPPSPADVAIQGDTAYVVLTDVWQAASIVNIKGPAAGIKIGVLADTGGAYPRAIALGGNTAYVANSGTDEVSLLSAMNLQPSKIVRVGDTSRNITIDGQWVLTSNAAVDEADFARSGGPTLTCLNADGTRVLTTTVKLNQDDSMVPEAVLIAPSGETSKAAWVVNIGSRGEIRIYDMAKLCPAQ